MRRLLPLVLAALALVPLLHPPTARAASGPLSLTDPAGDELDTRPSMDILKVTMETKKVKPTDPTPSIVITMQLSAAPEQRLTTYAVEATIPNCGNFNATYAPGAIGFQVPTPQSPASIFVCTGVNDPADPTSGSDLFTPKFAVHNNTLTWTVALDSLPKAARAGKQFTDIWAFTEISDPIFGTDGTADIGGDGDPHTAGVPIDDLSTDKTFTFA